MKKILIPLLLIGVISVLKAQNTTEMAVANAIESLRQAMIGADAGTLKDLTSEHLSYGHSSGNIEDQTAFVEALTNGKSKILKLTFTEQKIQVTGNVATVRNIMDIDIQNENEDPRSIHLMVLMTWINENGQWILLSRQAVRI